MRLIELRAKNLCVRCQANTPQQGEVPGEYELLCVFCGGQAELEATKERRRIKARRAEEDKTQATFEDWLEPPEVSA